MEEYEDVLLSDKKYREQREYWLRQLSDLEFDRILDRDYSQRLTTCTKEKIAIHLEPELSKRFIKISKNTDMALYIIFLAVLKCFLFKYTGKTDLWTIGPLLAENPEYSLNDFVIIRNILFEELTIKQVSYTLNTTALYGSTCSWFEIRT